MIRVALALVCCTALLGCARSDGGAGGAGGDGGVRGGDQSKSLTPEEVGQGMQLCRGYVQRLCKCAEADPSLVDLCDMSRSQPTGLEMTVKFLAGSEGPISTRERLEAEAGARKIIAACVRADSTLDPKKCPR